VKKWLAYAVLGVAVYLVALVLTLPAEQVYARIAERVPVALNGVDGPWWSGRAASARAGAVTLERLSWQVRVPPLLSGAVELKLAFASRDARGSGSLGRTLGGTLYLENAEARLPAQAVAPQVKAAHLRPTGFVIVELNEVRLAEGRLESAEGRIQWELAGVEAPTTVLLGDFTLTLETGDRGITGRLTDGGGPLEVGGTVSIAPDGAYRLTLKIAPRPSAPPQLAQALALLGRPGPDGKTTAQFTGKVPLPRVSQ
jgi:general secretion pathway protein N